MIEGQPTPDQFHLIIGKIYVDAYQRIQFLENENKKLRDNQQKCVALIDELRIENTRLMGEKECNNGNGNTILPESLREKFQSQLTE